VIYFFDNSFSRKIVRALGDLGVGAIHLQDELPEDASDVAWLRLAGERRWVAVTGDARIVKAPREREALRAANIVVVVMHKGFVRLDLWNQAAWLIKNWRTIDGAVGRAAPGTNLRVGPRGQIERLR
jgi:predicted nuclease of predicted toxin-antitoxin system